MVFPLLALAFLTACASRTPTPEQLASANYGPTPRLHKEAIREYFNRTLKDPYSVVYQKISEPVKGWTRDPLISGGAHHFGWLVDATINAKNAYGGYVGYKTYSFLLRDDTIIDVITPETPMAY